MRVERAGLDHEGADCDVVEWSDALEKLKAIDLLDVIPGHGEPFKGKGRVGWFQAYPRDLWRQATTLHDQKVRR